MEKGFGRPISPRRPVMLKKIVLAASVVAMILVLPAIASV
jgi:hypothetical protein